MVAALYRNTKQHWNTQVHGLTYNVLKLLMDADPVLFDEVSAKCKSAEASEQAAREDKYQKWKELRAAF